MDRLKALIELHGRWHPLSVYVNRIEGFRDDDFTLCIENAKSLLESIAKEICTQRSQSFTTDDNTGKILKLAFSSFGYSDTSTILQIGGAIANIGQQMGNLRNEIGATSHGKPLAELESRKDVIDKISSEFLLFSTESVACFLIELFETEYPRKPEEQELIELDDNDDFNEYLDDLYGEFEIGNSSYAASEILYNVDLEAYITELSIYKAPANEDTD